MSIIQIVSSQQPETNENSVESEPRVISRAEARRAHSRGSGGPSVKGSQEGHVTRSEFGDFEEGSGKRWPLLDWMRSKAGAGPQLRVSVVCFEKAGEIKSDWDAVAKSSARRERLAVHRTVCPSERREELLVFTQKWLHLLVCISIRWSSSRGSLCGRHYLKWRRTLLFLGWAL